MNGLANSELKVVAYNLKCGLCLGGYISICVSDFEFLFFRSEANLFTNDCMTFRYHLCGCSCYILRGLCINLAG